MSSEKPPVVIDNGSHYIKAGFSCDNHPVCMFRTVVGRPKYLGGKYGRSEPYDVYVGDEASKGQPVAKSEDLDLSSPVVNGRIVQWDNMERIWHHIFYRELKVATDDRAVILACSPVTPMSEKIKICQVFFEVLNTPALCIQTQSVLALYGSGFTTGINVDLGYDSTDINPVYEGGLISYAHMRTGLAGAQVSDFIKLGLLKRNLDLGVNAPEILDDIAKKCIYITPNSAMSWRNHSRPYKLPSGDVIDVLDEAFMAGELFFQPNLVVGEQTNILPLNEALITSALKCDGELRDELFAAVVMSGGLSMIPGVNERLKTLIESELNRGINMCTSDESYVVSWLGGAIFAGIPDAKRLWVTKKQYEDHGAKIIKNRFM